MKLLPSPANDNSPFPRTSMDNARLWLRRAAEEQYGDGATFAEREKALLTVGNEAARLNIEEDLQAMSNKLVERISIDNVIYARHSEGTIAYHTLCGSVMVTRSTYRRPDERNGATVVPLDLAAGLVEGATPALAYRVALGYAQGPSRHTEQQMHADYRRPPSRSTLERIGKRIGTQARELAPRIEPYMRDEEKLPEGAHAISIGLDRTTVPMEELRSPDAPIPQQRRQRTAPYVRKTPARIDVNYRMAYVGTVSVVDKHGKDLTSRRYAASAELGPDEILTRMMADVARAKAQNKSLAVGIMQDGSPEMWNLMREACRNEPSVSTWHEGIDRYHVSERLGEVLRIGEPDTTKRSVTYADWNYKLDRDDGTIDSIGKWLNQKILETKDEDDLETLEEHRTFISNNNDRMRYATLKNVGLPNGSGTTEGACKSVVMIRAKGCGQRWHDNGVNAALTLRSLYMSERLASFWPHFSNDYLADVLAA